MDGLDHALTSFFFAKRTLNSVEINPQSLRASPAAVKLEERATTAIAGRRGCQIRLPLPQAELEATGSAQPRRQTEREGERERKGTEPPRPRGDG